jgi:asparagine synthase (glutamine-hydrolysing)
LLDVAAVHRLWAEHVSGHSNWAYALWTVLMYEAWRRRWADHVAASGGRTLANAAP